MQEEETFPAFKGKGKSIIISIFPNHPKTI
jgi:hypothetical protein